MYVNSELKPLTGFPEYGLCPGDNVIILKGDMCQIAKPAQVKVVKEYPAFIVFEFFYPHWTGVINSYRKCLNKAAIAIGEAVFQKEEIYDEERSY